MVGTMSDQISGEVTPALAVALAAASAGTGRLVLLLGEAGIGKTTAARNLVAAARRSGVAVRWSACSSSGATVAHGPWLTLLSGLGPAGRRAMDGLLGSAEGDMTATASARAAAYRGVVTALEEVTQDQPALLVLDDLHWSDDGSLQLLDVVAAHAPGLALLVLGTYRDTDVPDGSPVTRLGGRADRLPLAGLDEAGVTRLLGDHLGQDAAAAAVTEVLALTAGNPFLVVQVARMLAEDPAALGRSGLPIGAMDLLRQRLGALSVEDRTALVAAAVLGSPFTLDDLGRVLAQDPATVAASLERVASRRIVVRTAGTGSWAFVHDLFRQVAQRGADPADLTRLHQRAATVREDVGAEPAVIASHLLAAGEGQRARAMRWSVRAGDRALASMAWEEAAVHYRRALGVAPEGADIDVRADALAGLGRARLLEGDEQGATEAFDALAAAARSAGSPEMLARAALGFSADLSGFEVRLFDQHQIDLLQEAADLLDGTSALGTRATVLARLSVAQSLSAPDSRRLELAEEAVALARRAEAPVILARALAAHCDAIAGPDAVDRRRSEAEEIVAIAEAEDDRPLELLGRRLAYVACLERGDVAEVEAQEAGYARRAASIGNPLYSWYVPLWKAQRAMVAGELERAEGLAEEVESLGRAAGSTNGPVLAMVLRLLLLWERGDGAAVVREMGALEDEHPDLAVHLSSLGARAWSHVLAGGDEEATAVLDRAAAIGLDALVVDAEWLANMVNFVRAAAAVDHPLLAEAVHRLEPHADLVAFEGIGAGLYGAVGRFVAEGCTALGRGDDAVRHARAALELDRAFGGMLVADALRTLARCLEAQGDRFDEAEARHRQADERYAAVGATHLVRPADPATESDAEGADTAPVPNEVRRDGDLWHLTYGGTSVVLPHRKGLGDLAILLSRPGREVHVSELAGVPAEALGTGGGDALDRRAIVAYRDRLADLGAEIDDAHSSHDLGRAEQAQREYDVLVDQLAGAVGLGGRRRAAGPEPVERLRKAVSARLRDAIARIGEADGPLGRHLSHSVRTGTYCAYEPEVPTEWVRTGQVDGERGAV